MYFKGLMRIMKHKEGNILLVAKNKEGVLITLINMSKEELEHQRRIMYYCPGCNGRVFLKAGIVKIPHFAHAVNKVCDYASEGESNEHLQGKQQLFEWMAKQGYKVELEKYFSEIKQRADLYVECNGNKFAIEYQCALIPLEDIKRRTLAYIRHKITPIWILNDKYLKSKKCYEYSLSSFQWYMSAGNSLAPQLFFYSPIKNQFTILQHLTPFSSRFTFSFPRISPLKNIRFTAFIKPSDIFPLKYVLWMNKKQRWRMNAAVHATCRQIFYQEMYLLNVSPATIPNEIGIPVPFMHLYETNAIQWQFWLFQGVFVNKSEGDAIRISELRSALIQCIKEKKIVLRHLPGISSINPFLPIEHYLLMLEKLQIVTRVDEATYTLKRPFELFNPVSPEIELDFYKKISNIYDELMKNAFSSYNKYV